MGNKLRSIKFGDTFNRLQFIKELNPVFQENGNRKRYGLFRCTCGIEKRILIFSVTSGITVSCGCYGSEMRSKATVQRNVIHGLSKHDLYKRWLKMKSRCLNPKDKRYNDYGGRGIKICAQWKNNFMAFYEWAVRNGYSEDLEIDRANNNKGYNPFNCRFVTTKDNCNNTRRNIIVDYLGDRMTLSKACERAKLKNKYRNIWQSVKSGKTFEESIKSYQKKE